MALFGSDMTEVVTPDGRRITVPSQLAAQFPGLTPARPPAPPMPDQLGTGPTVAPAETPAAPPILPVAPPAPAFSPQDNADLARLSAPTSQATPKAAPVTSPAQLPEPGAANTPPPVTNAALGAMGNAGVYNAESAALDQQKQANEQAGRVDADVATKQGQAYAERDAEAHRIIEARAKAANDDATALNSKMAEYQRESKAIANTKIDRDVDHPILAAIGVALGALGASMEGHGGKNPALDALFMAIDRKVAGQMADLDKRRASLGDMRGDIAMQRDVSKDRLAEYDKRYMAAVEQAKQKIETIGAQSGSDRTKAAVQTANAALTAKAAERLGDAANREQQKIAAERTRKDTLAMHAQTIGATIRGQNIQASQFDRTLDYNARKEAAELAEKYAALGEKGKADKAKHVGEAGIWDPSTGKVMLDPEGRKKMGQADQLEAQSRQVTDPDQQKKLNDTAAALRESAQINNAITAPSKEVAEKVRPFVFTAQQITDEASHAEKMLSGDLGTFDRAQWSALKTTLGDLASRYPAMMGERVSIKAVENAMENIIGFDPDSMFSRAADKGKALASLKELRRVVAESADGALKSDGIQSGWRPSDRNTPTAKFGGKTAQEVGAGEEPGFITRNVTGPIAHQIGNALHPVDVLTGDRPAAYDPAALVDRATDSAAQRTNAQGVASKYGLDPADDDRLRALIAQDASANHSAHADIVRAIAQPLTKSERPSLATGMLSLVRDESPALYREVMASLTPAQARNVALPDPVGSIPGIPGEPPMPNRLGPDAMAAYNAYLRSQGLPPVSR